MGFSQKVKKELCAQPLEAAGCVRAELAGMLTPNSIIVIDEQLQPMRLIFNTDQPCVAARVFRLYKALYGEAPTADIPRKGQPVGKHGITLTFNHNVRAFLKELRLLKSSGRIVGIDDTIEDHFEAKIVRRDGEFKVLNFEPVSEVPVYYRTKQRYLAAYLRGVFLACGTIADPEKGYRFELICNNRLFLESIQETFPYYDIKAYFTTRKKKTLLFSKEAQSVTHFLGVIGANKALFELENVRAMKELRNATNRRVNADIANINKISSAAQKYLNAIEKIESTIGLDALAPGLKMLALKRKVFPDVSLTELGEECEPPMDKSAVYRRLNKLLKMAEGLQ